MIFEVKNASFGYNSKKIILKDINFLLKDGQVMSVLGSNGVGKTTLLKCMMGFLKWNKGQTYIDNVELEKIPHRDMWKKIAYVPQAKGSVYGYTCLDMVVLGRSTHIGTFKQPKSEDFEIAKSAMRDVGIEYLKDKLCTQISGGELQMVLIARALTTYPKMLVLDEPESNLDFKNQLIILQTIKKLSKEKNISCIVNTHYPAHAIQISDKALMLNKDTTNFYGNAEDIITKENMKKSFSVNVHVNEFKLSDKIFRSVVPLSIA